VHAIASAIHGFASIVRRPATSLNVGTIHGGIAVNAIPTEAVIEVDLRSSSAEYLNQLQAHVNRSVRDSAAANGVDFRMELMGERPIGKTPVESPLVQAALEVTRRMGLEPQLDVGSTDANIPMSLGIPAIAIGAGGTAGNVHTPEEWFDPTHREIGLQRLLGLIAVLAGID
jgi:acetylornithine deacetylase/succinyl-diaminopimelate desuccinylase-like protein